VRVDLVLKHLELQRALAALVLLRLVQEALYLVHEAVDGAREVAQLVGALVQNVPLGLGLGGLLAEAHDAPDRAHDAPVDQDGHEQAHDGGDGGHERQPLGDPAGFLRDHRLGNGGQKIGIQIPVVVKHHQVLFAAQLRPELCEARLPRRLHRRQQRALAAEGGAQERILPAGQHPAPAVHQQDVAAGAEVDAAVYALREQRFLDVDEYVADVQPRPGELVDLAPQHQRVHAPIGSDVLQAVVRRGRLHALEHLIELRAGDVVKPEVVQHVAGAIHDADVLEVARLGGHLLHALLDRQRHAAVRQYALGLRAQQYGLHGIGHRNGVDVGGELAELARDGGVQKPHGLLRGAGQVPVDRRGVHPVRKQAHHQHRNQRQKQAHGQEPVLQAGFAQGPHQPSLSLRSGHRHPPFPGRAAGVYTPIIRRGERKSILSSCQPIHSMARFAFRNYTEYGKGMCKCPKRGG